MCPIHGAGVIIPPNSINVTGDMLPQARATDRIACPYGPPDFIVTGAFGTNVNGLMAARLGDKTMHGGTITSGSLDIEIGGPTAGATLGRPDAWLQDFNNAAAGRTSGSIQQTYGNCGIESSRLILLASGKQVTEDQLFNWALNNNQAQPDPQGRPTHTGGTYPRNWPNILASQGVNAHTEPASPEAIQQAVAENRGVISPHDAGKLWNDPSILGGHAITVTGVEYDANGKPAYYLTNDTGLGQGRLPVPARQFEGSLYKNNIGFTDQPVK